MSKLQQSKKFKSNEGDALITVTQLPGMEGARTLIRLGEILGPGLAGLAAAVRFGRADHMSVAMATLFKSLTGDTFEELLRKLLETATVKTKGTERELLPEWDLLMQGQASEWFKILWFALEVNYGNFTDALAGLDEAKLGGPLKDLLGLGARKPLESVPKAKEATPSPSTSFGPPND